MHITLPELTGPATLLLDEEQRLSDDEYFAFCEANPDLQLERTAQGEIIIVPPHGGESDYRNLDAASQLKVWSKAAKQGKAFGPSVQFFLPDGSARSPDAAWVSSERLALLTKEQRRQFLRLVPEFVIEVLSPRDRLRAAQRKMGQWMANGVELGWLIDGDRQCVHVYRQGSEPEQLRGISQLEGEGPVAGFTLDLTEIWEGL